MGLTYHFKIRAPASASPDELEVFLKKVEGVAKQADFKPTHVFRAQFDTRTTSTSRRRGRSPSRSGARAVCILAVSMLLWIGVTTIPLIMWISPSWALTREPR